MQQDTDSLHESSTSTVDPSLNGSTNYVKLETCNKSTSVALLKTLSMNHIKSEYSSEKTVITSNKQWGDMESQRHGSNQLHKSKSASRRENLLRDYRPPSTRDEFTDSEYYRDDEVYFVKQEIGYCSYAFSAIQTLVLIVMMIQCTIAPLAINPMLGPPPDALDYWGGKNAFKILNNNEEWRLITPIFLHAGIIHLLCNVSVQLDIGAFFEREWGWAIWLFIYLTSAVGSSMYSVCMKPNNVSVGSSGAVMGLFGGKLGEIICRACESKKTSQGRIGHEVRREQLGAVLCSVFVVLAFSFVPCEFVCFVY
jgi:membrane associated rhomboid family serine protease